MSALSATNAEFGAPLSNYVAHLVDSTDPEYVIRKGHAFVSHVFTVIYLLAAMPERIALLPPAIQIIRKRPEMYAPFGTDAIALAWMLQGDAMRFGARHTRIDVISGWYLVSADLDWLTPPVQSGVTVEALFRRIVPVPQHGPNACRADVIVAAFASAGIAAVPGEVVRVFGDMPAPPDVVEALCPPGCARTVAIVVNGS